MKEIILSIILTTVVNIQLFAQSMSQQYQESLITWKTLKAQHGNTYFYMTTYSGMAGKTDVIIYVENDEVIKKQMLFYGHQPTADPEITIYEEAKDLKNTKTMDEIYKFTLNEVLSKQENMEDYQIYFTLNEHKLISKTGYYPLGCKDDCFVGYSIVEINWY